MIVIELMTVTELARALNVSKASVYNLIKNDKIEIYKFPGKKKKFINPKNILDEVTYNPRAFGKYKLQLSEEQRNVLQARREGEKDFIIWK